MGKNYPRKISERKNELHAGSSSDSAPQYYDQLPPQPDQPEDVPKYTEHAIENVYIPASGEEPPPDFMPYEAEYFISGISKDIVSHDPHLNQDGEALYRFLLSQSMQPPQYLLHIRGTHTEHRTRTVTSTGSDGRTTSRTENYSETVTDFDFFIDLGSQLVHGPVHWSVPDSEPAYRGQMVMEVDSSDFSCGDPELALPSARHTPTKEETKAAKEAKKLRKHHGLPPWVAPGPDSWFRQNTVAPAEPAVVLKSSKTLRQWADEYCASEKVLKEFTYTKVVYGWNCAGLRDAITATIRSVYKNEISVQFKLSSHKIRIRPDNGLSRTLSNRCFKFLLCIFLIYPFVLLWKRFSQRGGGRWEVCGGAYAMKTWQRLPPGTPAPPNTHDGRWKLTPEGPLYLVGEREGEWFARWADIIRHSVRARVRTTTPLAFPTSSLPSNLYVMP